LLKLKVMNVPIITEDQQKIIDRVEFQLSEIKDQDLLYSSLRDLLYAIPNNYDLGAVVRSLFS